MDIQIYQHAWAKWGLSHIHNSNSLLSPTATLSHTASLQQCPLHFAQKNTLTATFSNLDLSAEQVKLVATMVLKTRQLFFSESGQQHRDISLIGGWGGLRIVLELD